MAKPLSSIIAPPNLTMVVMGMMGATVLPWKKVAELLVEFELAFNVPPLKLKVAEGLTPLEAGPACAFATAVPTRPTDNVPPFRLITPTAPRVLPLALRETSRLPQLSGVGPACSSRW